MTGLDNSEDMLDAARKRLPGTAFCLADIATWQPDQPQDVILANASLQWLPDHQQLYPRLVSHLAPGGSLAVQTPDNLEEPAHRLAREVAASGPWAATIGDVRHPARHSADFYYALLRPHCSNVDVWRTTYFHPLAGGHAAVVEWFKGSALRPFVAPLDEEQRPASTQRICRPSPRPTRAGRWHGAAALPQAVHRGQPLKQCALGPQRAGCNSMRSHRLP